jgi:amidophosphoribosyltransferase
MAKITDFIAFKAAIALLKDKGKVSIINEVYKRCREQIGLPKEDYINHVKNIYISFTDKELSSKIAELLKGRT